MRARRSTFLALAMAFGACSSGACSSATPGPPPSTTTTTAADVTVLGVVSSVSASAKVVTLSPPVAGVANLALTVDTQVVRADGSAATLADVVPGATVEATGRPSTAGTVVARRLVLL